MSKQSSRSKGKNSVRDSGYPFDTGDWAKWTNQKRLDWTINFRDKLRDVYKEKFDVSDEQIDQLSAQVIELENAILVEEFTAAQVTARSAATPRESAKMLGEIIIDICANDYHKARRMGMNDEYVEQMRSDADKYLREVDEWEKRQNANNILGIRSPTKPPTGPAADALKAQPGTTFDDIDYAAFKAAVAAGDEAAAHREFDSMIDKLEAKAEKDPIFAKWFEGFKAEQELLLRWDDTIGEDDED